MEILKTALEWAKAEMFSSLFFVLFGLLFALAALFFWQLGKTELAKAFVIPTLVAGVLLLAVGLGLFFTNKSRAANFTEAYNADKKAFIESEIARAKDTMGQYQNVFKVIPFIIVTAALLLIFLNTPLWRAIGITTIAMMAVILFVDSNANARIEAYNKQLVSAQKAINTPQSH